MANSEDQDKTEVNPESTGENDQHAQGLKQDYTEYQTTGSSDPTGFDQARDLARKAQGESGRLLKKRFVLEDVLGKGGMGVVYKARDLRKVEAQDSNPYIATKVLGQNFKDHPQAFISLQQEAVKSQKLAHPNIVTVHDFDRDGSTIFMTMELLKGDPLDVLLEQEAPFSRESAFRYFNELCSGLDYAHKRGLIHSDFKPANIFVTTGGIVKILDFGIARAANRDSQSSDFDAGDLGALTPAYATIEMVNREAPSYSDDVYALACVFYQMLTANHPYQRMSATDALAKKLKPKRPEILTSREWQALNQGLSLTKAKRPATIAEFRDSIIPPAKSPVIKIIAAIILAFVAGGAWFAFQQYKNEAKQQDIIEAKLQTAKDCFYRESYACTIENTRVVTSLAPGNTEAAELLKAAQQAQQRMDHQSSLNRLLSDAQTCLENSDHGCAKVKAREVLDLEPGQLQAQQILAEIAREDHKLGLVAYLDRANRCLDKGDVSCANDALNEASLAGAEPAELYEVRRRADTLAEKNLADERELNQSIEALLSKAKNCLTAKDFTCASAGADDILTLDSANVAALEIQQAVKLAREQVRANNATANNFLKEAETCYRAKNYACAIAKSESALAIAPNSTDAKAMKKKAQGTQKKAKMNISIE